MQERKAGSSPHRALASWRDGTCGVKKNQAKMMQHGTEQNGWSEYGRAAAPTGQLGQQVATSQVLFLPQPSPSWSWDHNPKVPSQILICLRTKALPVHVPNHMSTCMFCPHVWLFISTQQSTLGSGGFSKLQPNKCTKMPCERMTPAILHQKNGVAFKRIYILAKNRKKGTRILCCTVREVEVSYTWARSPTWPTCQ